MLCRCSMSRVDSWHWFLVSDSKEQLRSLFIIRILPSRVRLLSIAIGQKDIILTRLILVLNGVIGVKSLSQIFILLQISLVSYERPLYWLRHYRNQSCFGNKIKGGKYKIWYLNNSLVIKEDGKHVDHIRKLSHYYNNNTWNEKPGQGTRAFPYQKPVTFR